MRQPFVAILAVVGFLCATLLGSSATTRAGVQCPTAAVQWVVVRDCCGREFRRAPKPGERTFVQCRCAERKVASTQAMAAAKVDLLLPAGEPLVAIPSLRAVWTPFVYASPKGEWSVPPALQPPILS